MTQLKSSLTYENAGVDPAKAAGLLVEFAGHLKTRPRDPALLSGIGPFAACYELKNLLQRYTDPLLVTCCDGVGTKAKLALEWNAIDFLGQDLVAMNVNDLLCVGATPLLFLDYYACGKLEKFQLLKLLKSIQAGCEIAECSLAGGETAEMPGVYSGQDFDLAGFSVGLVDKPFMLGAAQVRIGDRLVAVASSGFHSNGYSLIRKIVEREKIQPETRAPFGPITFKEALLSPTTIYVPALKPLLGGSGDLHALAHITGGGLFENLPRVLASGQWAKVKSQEWRFPELFQWVQAQAGLSTEQMLSTFNCGVGMIAVCAPQAVSKICAQFEKHNIAAWDIGEVSAAPSSESGASRVLWQ